MEGDYEEAAHAEAAAPASAPAFPALHEGPNSPTSIGSRSPSYLESVDPACGRPPSHTGGDGGGEAGSDEGPLEHAALLLDSPVSLHSGMAEERLKSDDSTQTVASHVLTFADGTIPDGALDEFPRTYESLNLDRRDTQRYRESRCHISAGKQQKVRHGSRAVNRREWAMYAVIGVCVGIIAFIIDTCTEQMENLKLATLQHELFRDSTANGTTGGFTEGDPELTVPYFVFTAWDVAMVLAASALCRFFAPEARGSGIPEIKSFLNGVKRRGWLRLRTMVVKVIGIILVVSATMPTGKEGPMIHAGAILGAGLPQFKSTEFGLDLNVLQFRTDPFKQRFVAAGAAAGVAAAFGAPIGGILFALEEGVSFLTQALIWRSLAACVAAVLTVRILKGAVMPDVSALDVSSSKLVAFGTFNSNLNPLWSFGDLVVFAIMGAVGGVLGSLWCFLQKRLTQWRMRKQFSLKEQMWQTGLIALVNISLRFVCSMGLGECAVPKSTVGPCGGGRPDNVYDPDEDLHPFFCSSEHEYNDLATILFNSLVTSLKVLIHSSQWFNFTSLLVAFVVLFSTSCWTYGTLIPSGIFTPLLVTGAIMGRMAGQFVNEHVDGNINVGMYALVGSAAFLGGCVRMTVSLAVIIMEATNEIILGPPLLVTLIVAKLTGDLFDGSIYDIHIALAKIPLLEWEASDETNRLFVSDAMATPVVVCRPIERVDIVLKMLVSCKHNAFPVCVESQSTTDSHHKLQGLILRADLVLMLTHRVWGKRTDDHVDQPVLDPYAQKRAYGPRRNCLSEAAVQQSDGTHRHNWMDLRKYMLDSPYTMPPFAPLGRAFRTLRTLGLRHICVVEPDGTLVGILTRHDMTEHVVDELNEELDAATSPERLLHQE